MGRRTDLAIFRQTLPRIRTEYLRATSERGSQLMTIAKDGARLVMDCDENLKTKCCRAAAEAFCNSARSSRRAAPVGLGDLLPVSVYSSRDGIIA
jgi:hypothetical protein